MATQMTRAEYEVTFGAKPVATQTPQWDNEPAPVRMTLAEYQQQFGGVKPGQTKTSRVASSLNPFKLLNPVHHAKVTADIPNDIKGIFTGMWETMKETGAQINESRNQFRQGEISAGALGVNTIGDLAKGAVDAFIAEPFMGAVKIPFTKEQEKELGQVIGEAGGELFEATGNKYRQKVAEWQVGTSGQQEMAMFLNNVEKRYKDDPNFAAYIDGVGGVGAAVAEFVGFKGGSKVAKEGYKASANAAKRSDSIIKGIQRRVTPSGNKFVPRVASEIDKIESKYVNTRKAKTFEKDAGDASRIRIAESNVLNDAVDGDGLLQTKVPGGAYETYRKRFIEPYESVVRDNLVREKATINLREVENALKASVGTSGLVGGDLARALNGIKKEIDGLRLWADDLDNVELFKIHDAKIGETKHINFNTPPETATFRKAKAAAYKELVERKSSAKVDVDGTSFNVKGINKELKKFYDDLDRLERLDGKRVQGGKLGKYTAQLAGNIAGGALGSSGGAAGAAVGALIGGEVASGLKGVAMRRTLKGKAVPIEKNKVLEAAKAQAKTPGEFNLKKPDQPMRAPKNIPKTKEIRKVERDIKDNVKMQKAAIKANDFELVKALKEVYQALIVRLKELAKDAMPNKSDTPKDGFRKLQEKQGKIEGQVDKEIREAAISDLRDVIMSSEGGKLVKNTDGGYMRTSSHPQWVPADLRDTDLYDRVLKHHEKGTKPRLNAGREEELYELMEEQIKLRSDELKTPEASSSLPTDAAFGGIAGIQVDEEGNITFNPFAAALGVGVMGTMKKVKDIKVPPKTVAKNMDKEDYRKIAAYIDEPANIAVEMEVRPLLKAVGINEKTPVDLRQRYLKEVIDEFDGVAEREVIA